MGKQYLHTQSELEEAVLSVLNEYRNTQGAIGLITSQLFEVLREAKSMDDRYELVYPY